MSAGAITRFLIVVLIWGTTWIVIKTQLGVVNPSWSVTYRFAVGGLALLGWCALKRLPLTVPRSSLLFLALFGTFQFVLNFNFVYRSELYIPSGIPAVAFALLMVPNAILAALFLGRRITGRFMLGAAMGIAGVGMLFWQQLEFPGDRTATITGLSLVVAGILSASVANVMQASPQALRHHPLTGLAFAMLIGAAFNAVVAVTLAGAPTWDPQPAYLAGVLYLGVVASAVAFALYFELVRVMGPAEAAWTGVPIPLLAMGISTVLEGYRWTALAAAGSVLALAGLVVALGKPAPRAAEAQP
jgi:drug/metabolite transporter (DMT)-like permease